jgi:hypothetical protein
MCPNCVVDVEGEPYCVSCAPGSRTGGLPAWELGAESRARSWLATARAVALGPAGFFDHFTLGVPINESLRFFAAGVALGLPGAAVMGVLRRHFQEAGPDSVVSAAVSMSVRTAFAGFVALLVALAVVQMLARLAGARARPDETLRALAYVWGIAWPLATIPGPGWIAGPLVLFFGVRAALVFVHGLSPRRAAIVALSGQLPGLAVAVLMVAFGT